MDNKNITAVPALPQNLQNLAKVCETAAQYSIVAKAAVNQFERALLIATGVQQLYAALTDEVMKPIMMLQGSPLGFKTDKDKTGGYPVDVVRMVFIDAVFNGVEMVGNQINILCGNCYITKEGTTALLRKIPNTTFSTVCGIPRVNGNSAIVVVTLDWCHNGVKGNKVLEFEVRVNNGMNADGICGKATRKAQLWLYTYLTNQVIADGDNYDVECKSISDIIEEPAKMIEAENQKTDEGFMLEEM